MREQRKNELAKSGGKRKTLTRFLELFFSHVVSTFLEPGTGQAKYRFEFSAHVNKPPTRRPRTAHARAKRARGAPLLHVYDKKYDCFVKQMYRLSWFLSVFCCYAFWSAERYHAIFLSNQTQNQDQSSLISAAFSAFEFYFTNIPRTTVLLLIK